MNYIADSLIRADLKVQIISASWVTNPLSVTLPKTVKRNCGTTVKFGPSLNIYDPLSLKLTKFLSLTWLFFWMLLNLKKNDRVLIYHSPLLFYPVYFSKLIIGYTLILEVEEIYSEVWKISTSEQKKEKNLLMIADNYIPSSEQLSKLLGEKSLFVCHGCYKPLRTTIKKSEDLNINVVYAGTIDQLKGGAFIGLESFRYLEEKYSLHIAGYGSNHDINLLKNRILDINSKLNRNAVIYHGMLNEEDLSNLLNKCSIALNPQKTGDYMNTAFPSKLLVYLSYGLSVVSSKISSILNSDIANLVNFVERTDPISFANAIQKVNTENSDEIIQSLQKLDEKFVSNLKTLFIK